MKEVIRHNACCVVPCEAWPVEQVELRSSAAAAGPLDWSRSDSAEAKSNPGRKLDEVGVGIPGYAIA